MKSEYYYVPGAGKIKAHRVTLIESIQMWWRRRKRRREVNWF